MMVTTDRSYSPWNCFAVYTRLYDDQ